MPRKPSPSSSRAHFMAPMQALGSTQLPAGKWHCEIKYDGYRSVAVIAGGAVELWSRNRKSMTPDYPAVVEQLRQLRCRSAVLDGEVVALDAQGRSRFQLLQNFDPVGNEGSLVYFIFDLMHLNGRDLTARPLEERRKILADLIGKGGRQVQLAPAFEVEPAQLFSQARKHGLEGIIAKRPGSLYETDRRSGAWVKCKVIAEQELVIGGFSEPQNSRQYFGAILVGYFEGGNLRYAGKVGTGFDRAGLAALHEEFLTHRTAQCPFSDLPSERRSRFGRGMGRAEMRKVSWIKPVMIAQVKFAEWTAEGLLRQPVFLGLRRDKKPKDVHREKAAVGQP